MRLIEKLKRKIGVGRNADKPTPVVVDVGSFKTAIGRNADHGIAVFMKRFAAFAEQELCPLTLVLPPDMAQNSPPGGVSVAMIPHGGSCAETVRKTLRKIRGSTAPVVVTADEEVAKQAQTSGAGVMRPMTLFKSLPALPHPHPAPQRPPYQQRREFHGPHHRDDRQSAPAREPQKHTPPTNHDDAATPASTQSQHSQTTGTQPRTIMDLIDPL